MEKGVTIKRGKRDKNADNENTNTQIVNVVVVGEKDTKSIANNKAENEAKQQNRLNGNRDYPAHCRSRSRRRRDLRLDASPYICAVH